MALRVTASLDKSSDGIANPLVPALNGSDVLATHFEGAGKAPAGDGSMLAFVAMDGNMTQVAVMKPESGNWSILTRDRDHGPILNHS